MGNVDYRPVLLTHVCILLMMQSETFFEAKI